ncbi:MAG: MarR family winged helix-turn-helix transcriptional regulator [Sneathiellales bacterium]|nr:MarR family winged helix-turn-helix transcriptional regulator [Sneathiellales bacterium]
MEFHSETQKQALKVGEQCFAARLRKLNRMVSKYYDDCFRPFGITVAQFNLLTAISARGETSPTLLVKTLCLEKSTVSRNIEKMITRGWISAASGEDKRTQILTLTDEGAELMDVVLPAWREAQEKTEKAVGDLAQLVTDVQIS